MRYSDRTASTSAVLMALRSQVVTDMSGLHGVSWWEGLNEPRNLLTGDYLIGLTESAGTNLNQAAMHLKRFITLRDALDFEMLRKMRAAQARGSFFGPTTETFDDNDLEADGHLAGYFRALGSTLDNLGGVVVGTLGMPSKIVKASWTDLGNWATQTTKTRAKHALTAEHLALIDDVIERIATYLKGTPRDWIEWTMDYRNTLVHRASRLAMLIQDARSRSGFAHPVPRHPDQTLAESFAMSRSMSDDLMRREAFDTLNLVLDQLLELTTFIARTCVAAWAMRRDDSRLHNQPIAQWPTLQQGRRLEFDGAGREASFREATAMVIHPTLGDRLQVTRVMDKDRAQWNAWVQEDRRA